MRLWVLSLLILLTPVLAQCDYACASCEDCTNALRFAGPGETVCLKGDIAATGTCINLGEGEFASGLTLSCGDLLTHYTIRGDGTGIGVWIGPNVRRFTVINCNINDFNVGILAEGSGGHLLRLNNLGNNNYGVYLRQSSGNELSYVTISGGTEGIRLEDSNYNNISARVSDASTGLYLIRSHNNTITSSNFSYASYGIYMGNSTGNTLQNVEVFKNSKAGIYIIKSSSNTLSSLHVYDNYSPGIVVEDSSGTRILDARVENNREEGVALVSSTNVEIDGLLARWNDTGLHLKEVSAILSDLNITSNTNFGIRSDGSDVDVNMKESDSYVCGNGEDILEDGGEIRCSCFPHYFYYSRAEGNISCSCSLPCSLYHTCDYTCNSCDTCTQLLESAGSGEAVCLDGNISISGANCIDDPDLNDNVILDCRGYSMEGSSGAPAGIFLSGSESDHLIVIGCDIHGFSRGLNLAASYNQFYDINIHDSVLDGIWLSTSQGNIFSHIHSYNNATYDFNPGASSCDQDIEDFYVSGGYPLYFYNSSTNISGLTASLVVLCGADDSNVEDVSLCGADCWGGPKNNGLMIVQSSGVRVNNLRAQGTQAGIYFWTSRGEVNDIVVHEAENGIEAISSSDVNVRDVNLYENGNGLYLELNSHVSLSTSSITANSTGVWVGSFTWIDNSELTVDTHSGPTHICSNSTDIYTLSTAAEVSCSCGDYRFHYGTYSGGGSISCSCAGPCTEGVCDDNVDNDEDGLIDCGDSDCSTDAYCVDNDGDGYSEYLGDCNDSDANVYPGAPEVCDNNVDDDCDGNMDCSDSDCQTDADGDGHIVPPCGDDCNDSNPNIYPGALEVCDNGLDDDCDGDIDCGDKNCWFTDIDGDGYAPCENDCNDYDPSVNPDANEVCGDGIDNDCDGLPDYADEDCSPGSPGGVATARVPALTLSSLAMILMISLIFYLVYQYRAS